MRTVVSRVLAFSKRKILLSLIVLLLSGTAAFCHVAESGGWKITQYAKHLGIAKVEVCKAGVRVDLKQLGLVFVYNSALDDTFVYSNITKKICSAKKGGDLYGFFDGISMEQSGRLFAKFGTLDKPRNTKLRNINCSVSEYRTNQVWLPNRSTPIKCEASICLDDEVKISKRGLAMVSRLFALPSLGRLPLEATILVKEDSNPKPNTLLRTIRLENASPADEEFQPPKGYAQVDDSFAVSGKEDIVKSMIDFQSPPHR